MNNAMMGIDRNPDDTFMPVLHTESLLIPKKPKSDLVQTLKGTISKIRARDAVGYRRRHRRWLEVAQFYNGDQYSFWDDDEGSFHAVDAGSRRRLYINNFFSAFVDTTQKEWAKAKTELTVHAATDRPEAMGAAREGAYILAYYQRKLRGPSQRQQEGLTAALVGTYFRYTYFDINAGTATGQIPQTSPQTLSLSPDMYGCGDCGSQGNTSDQMMGGMEQPQCPECGSPNVQQIPGQSMETDSVTGSIEQKLGDIVTDYPDPFEIRVHPRARCGDIKSSPYLFRDRRMYKSTLSAAFNINLDNLSDTISDGEHDGLRFQKALERGAGASTEARNWQQAYSSTDNDEDTVVFSQCWLDYQEYKDWIFTSDTTSVTGQTIPAGIPLGEIYPDGLYFALIGSVLIDVRNENKNDHWVAGVYRIYPPSFWGRGVEDAIWQQKLLNDTYNLYIEYLKRCSSPTTLINTLVTDLGDYSGAPGELIPVQTIGMDVPLSNLIYQVPAAGMPQQIPAFIEDCKKSMQTQLGAFSVTSGMPDVDVTTATGMKLLREASVALIAMALAINAEVDAEWGRQVLELARKNFVVPRILPIEGNHGVLENKWFSSIDIAAELVVSYTERSIMPRSEAEQQNEILSAMSAGNLAMGIWNPQVPPELRRVLAERFNVPIESNLQNLVERQFKFRLDQIEEFCQMAQQIGQQMPEFLMPTMQPDPMTGQMVPGPSPAQMYILEQVPINPKMDDHDMHMKLIQEWFLSDKGLFADELTKEVMEALFDEHMQGKIQVEQMMSQAAIMGQAPAMMAQAQMGATMGGASNNAMPTPATKGPQTSNADKIAPPPKPNI